MRARDAAREFYDWALARMRETPAHLPLPSEEVWREEFIRGMSSILLRAAAGERERACRAICDQCAEGVPVELDDLTSGEWVHENGEGCFADAIRQLTEEE